MNDQVADVVRSLNVNPKVPAAIVFLLAVGVILLVVLNPSKCNLYRAYVQDSVRGKVVAKYLRKVMTLDVQCSDKLYGMGYPSSRLWTECNVGDSLIKSPGVNSCLVIRPDGRRMVLPFVPAQPECDAEMNAR